MNIGETIKRIRRSRDMTQEQLAEELNLSPQAISRWETGQAMPDITLIPSIAGIFNVTVDELFGMEEVRSQEYRGNVFRQAHEHISRGLYDEAAAVYREALKSLPRDYGIMSDLALTLAMGDVSSDSGKLSAKEAIKLCAKVLDNSTHDKLRSTTRVVLCFLLSSSGDSSGALEECKRLPHFWESREMLYPELLDGAERIEYLRDTVLSVLGLLGEKINDAKNQIHSVKKSFAVGPSDEKQNGQDIQKTLYIISDFLKS
ncbi:MAG: helix-turn-helix domain-containing protein [Eubacteriales bacterium]